MGNQFIMSLYTLVFTLCALMCCVQATWSQSGNPVEDIKGILSPCKKSSSDFDKCIQQALNKLRRYFKKGVPELGIDPLDPFFVPVETLERTLGSHYYNFTIENTQEYGWAQAAIINYKTEWDKERITFTQHFPVKIAKGYYHLKADWHDAVVRRSGMFNVTLWNYMQTLWVTRDGTQITVGAEVGPIGDMEIHITNLLGGYGRSFGYNKILEQITDLYINKKCRQLLVVIKSSIEHMAGASLSYLFTKNLGNITLEEFIQD